MSGALNSPAGIALVVGLMFAPLGGLTAGIIIYMEYSQHRLPRGRTWREALRSGLFATVLLAALTALFGLLMGSSW